MIIYGTGFAATEFLRPMQITGADGADLHAQWKDGARAYLGLCVPDFPNLFVVYGPNTNLGGSSIINMLEVAGRRHHHPAATTPQPTARERWPCAPRPRSGSTTRSRQRLADSVWACCHNWYHEDGGRISTNWPGTGRGVQAALRRARPRRLRDRLTSPMPTEHPIFVVQRHDASTLHYDLRLQVGDVLASWAVPKGPSLDPRDKRLAKQVGDHALDYATFEGRIEGAYGAGTVIVWDIGTLTNLTQKKGSPVPLERAVADGHLKVELHGQKLSGAFALTRTNMGGDPTNWILVKIDDSGADRRRSPATTELQSVISSKTNEDFQVT